MRRDLIVGILVSLLLHGGVIGVGELLKEGPPKPKAKEEEQVIELMKMPEIEEIEPEIREADDSEPAPVDFAPPMQTDVPQIVTVDSFVQQLQPPPPEGIQSTGVITIPQNRIVGTGGRGLGEIFDLSKLDQQPSPRFQAKPVYPFEMRRAGITGEVVVGFIVNSNGDVVDAHAVRSTQREFEAAAIQAVSKWKFKPGRKGGRAVNTRMMVPIVFSITEE